MPDERRPTRWPWDPLTRDEVVDVMAGFPARWWFTGGTALELFAGTSWREHDDVDIGVCRADAVHLPAALQGWEISVAAAGKLMPWRGKPLAEDRAENNLWVRRKGGPWQLDIVVGSGSDTMWIYRRDPSLRMPWERALRTSPAGVPFLAPELQLLFKSKDVRPKDTVDAEVIIPLLDDEARALLAAHLPADHPWRPLLEAR